MGYGVALVRRMDKIIGLFCKRGLQKRRYSAKETYNFIDPICVDDSSHFVGAMCLCVCVTVCVTHA